MSAVWFTSDLHLGHEAAVKFRKFKSVEEHDDTIIYNLASMINKKDKLFILGDVAWRAELLKRLDEIPGTKELIIGNHDTFTTQSYLKYFYKVHGFRGYKNFWLSHCPMHPQEMYRKLGNIHGHLHTNTSSKPLPLPYYNVNLDYNNYHPVNVETIKEAFKRYRCV